jgi:membrane associated rhomboid family serine protease
MFSDDTFNGLLDDNKIITPDDSAFQGWHQKKTKFNLIINKSITYKHGYSPKKNNLSGLFTCMFLHGGFMHLVGNMVFLYLVGAILEIAIGPLLFLLLYLVTGICASALFGIVYPTSPGPLVGASGAIAGLMGAYGIIFGFRKIRVFYTLGFYFNYAMVPALNLFPIWLAQEFLQLHLQENSNVAYIAHIGGLISGLVIGAVYKILLRQRIDSLFIKSETKQSVEKYLESGQEKLLGFDLPGARISFEKALERRAYPGEE